MYKDCVSSPSFLTLNLTFCRDGEELSTRDLQKMVQSMPQYNEIKEKLSIHVEVGLCLCQFPFSNTSKLFLVPN